MSDHAVSLSEIVDILDEQGNKIGETSRGVTEKENHITANVLVFIFDSSGKVWIQHRPKNKRHYPDMWDISACGSVLSSETPEEAAERELLEETGIKADLNYIESFLNVCPAEDGRERKRLSYLYIGESNDQPVANDEADGFKLLAPDELRQNVLSNPSLYIPSFLIELEKALAAYQLLKSGN